MRISFVSESSCQCALPVIIIHQRARRLIRKHYCDVDRLKCFNGRLVKGNMFPFKFRKFLPQRRQIFMHCALQYTCKHGPINIKKKKKILKFDERTKYFTRKQNDAQRKILIIPGSFYHS